MFRPSIWVPRSFSSNLRRPKPRNSRLKLAQMFLPHTFLAAGLIATSNAHLLVLPASTALLHYLYRYNHLKKLTLYYDMNKMASN